MQRHTLLACLRNGGDSRGTGLPAIPLEDNGFNRIDVPIAIFKNAVRIVTISSLSVYVDRTIIDGPLHHKGGPVFAIVDLAIFVPLLIALQRSETRSRTSTGVIPAAGNVSSGLPASALKEGVQ